ncbi:unnamed protein product [Menidia menidia]|uniref:(Atlantic silverside) hypothetical protein n=1 Tax=Menidia menidia TaxID=238744 RepID=A0A8S4BRY8_9TELE|nr:unnamed protein product [Menidia menidia]
MASPGWSPTCPCLPGPSREGPCPGNPSPRPGPAAPGGLSATRTEDGAHSAGAQPREDGPSRWEKRPGVHTAGPGIQTAIMTTLLSLLMLGVSVLGQELPSSPHGCTEGSCYPATGNLLIGRAVNLNATSTCGLNGPQQYCIVSHLQEPDKCFECDSGRPYDAYRHRNSHRIQNVIYLTDANGDPTWWQSVNGKEDVSIRLNLEAEFHFTHLIMKFKTFRPAAMIIERSADFGRSWRPYRYFASNCTRTFPGVPARGLQRINDVICEERYSDIEPSTNGELLRITNLRINFTKLNTLGDDLLDRRSDVLQKYYYALYELVVRGSCFCYGHASECAPVEGVAPGEAGMIHGSCICNHNTEGLNCERCRDFYDDLPWRPAEAQNPHTCRACNCDPRGIIMTGAACDQISGDCFCKRYVTGRYCDQCQPEYWGLSNDLAGCRACDCDFGGAFNNKCTMENGQCDCRKNLIGRQCSDVQPGFFCAPLDYLRYEAEDAAGHPPSSSSLPGKVRPQASDDCIQHLNNQARRHRRHGRISSSQQHQAALRRIRQLQQTPDVAVVRREHSPSHMVTWTGPGFARVKDGAGLVFTIDNIPFAMEYDLMIRYEPEQSTEDWEAVVSISSVMLPSSLRCGNLLPTEQLYTQTLLHRNRYVQMSRPFCFEPDNRYVVAIRFQRHGVAHRHLTAFILIDSLVLIPKYTELSGFQGNGQAAEQRQEDMARYMCLDSFMITPTPVLAEMCSKLICSISSIIYDGALPCRCDPQGALSGECERVGGQCRCKPNVIGRRCGQCAPGTYGYGIQGCTGARCDQCAPGYYGNPEQPGGQCSPCRCNNNIDPQDPGSCDRRTGRCLRCLHHTDGPACARCQQGYYGNALTQDCRLCTCVTAGTLPAACPDGPCHCDHQTGACPCRENVVGHNCDQCADNYWNYGRDGGCQPCGCSPGHALGAHCNMFTGQCHCRPGFGGRQCTECEQFHWGDPRVQCQECNCHPLGSEMAQCDRLTGQCECREGAAGGRCEECARGFSGSFPSCARCHACFQLWDDIVCQIKRDLDHIQYAVERILENGVLPGGNESRIKELERKLRRVQDLIRTEDNARIHQMIGQSIDDLRAEIALTDGRLMGIGRELNATAGAEEALKSTLDDLEKQLRDVNGTMAHKKHLLDNYLSSGFADQFEKVKKSYRESLQAEEKCNASVSGPVEQSAETRAKTELLLNETREAFLQDIAAQNKSIKELQEKASDLDEQVRLVSNKVCGGGGNASANGSCPESPCGGAGCRDDRDELVCGGTGCDGTVSSAEDALSKARNVSHSLDAFTKDLQTVSRKLEDLSSLTRSVKNQTMATLEKAQQKKEYFEKSNKDLKDLIKKIKDFLTEEGADPESIEKIAKQVLSITLPFNRTTLDHMVRDIKDSLANLTTVEGVVNQTSQHISTAKELLKRAKDAESQAVGVRDAVNVTKQALEESEKAIQKAESALKDARDNLNGTQNTTAELLS